MRARIVIILCWLFYLTCAFGQTDNTVYVKQFNGVDVGTKVANAQAACPSTSLPCILVLDPSLAGFPAGTMPTLNANVSLQDYRNGVPGVLRFTQSGTGVTALNFTTCFSSSYNIYDITYSVQLLSSGTLGFQFYVSGAYDTGSNYQQSIYYLALGSSAGNSAAGPSSGSNMDVTGSPGGTESVQNYSGTIRVYNVNSTTQPKPVSGELFNYGSSLSAAANKRNMAGMYGNLAALAGVRLFSSAASGFTGTATCIPVSQ